MAETRTPYRASTSGTITGDAYMTETADNVNALWDASCLPLSSVSGTDTVTASVDPAFTSEGYLDGMKFTITWANANTGSVTLDINSEGAAAVVDAAGDALSAGALTAGARSLLEYVDGSFRILAGAGLSIGGSVSVDRQTFTTSATWTKPTGYSDEAVVRIYGWGAGCGGISGPSAGGAGGAYRERIMRYGDVSSSVGVVIGSGGAVDSDGGDTTFGSYLTAPGAPYRTAAGPGGGDAGSGSDGGDAKGIWGGGGGAASGTSSAVDGGSAVYGGGGGGAQGGVGGTSEFGGAGGDSGSPGEAPGGGGGANAAGARGELVVEVWE